MGREHACFAFCDCSHKNAERSFPVFRTEAVGPRPVRLAHPFGSEPVPGGCSSAVGIGMEGNDLPCLLPLLLLRMRNAGA
eukprot:9099880-Heterocapsa_arctica.AAC.1